MAVPIKRPGFSWMWVLLLTGLSLLSWISTYTGIMELISASSGAIDLLPRVAVAFAVFMLQLMILYILDAMFSDQLRWWLRPLYAVGYFVLFLIAVGFAFGFYWKYLEAGSATTSAAETSLGEVEVTMQLGTSRLEQLQTTFMTLGRISSEKAEKERTVGGTCVGSAAGDGPRRRLRDADAQRFQFANEFTAQRVTAVKADITAVSGDLQKLLLKDPATIDAATGSRNAFIGELNRRLSLVATRFNALRTDPQLRQLSDEFKLRAVQTTFPDDRGGTIACPDPQLQTALNGVVRAIGELPELHPALLRAYEGSEAVVEAFRRLTVSGVAAANEIAATVQNGIAATGLVARAQPLPPVAGGLTQRDYIPLLIAIFVDICILLVSINRPFSRVFRASWSMEKARQSNLIEFLMPVYRVFINNFDPDFRPKPEEVIAPLVDVVFDNDGRYFAAAPLDYREQNYANWVDARAKRAKERGETFAYDPNSDRPLERSRYISSALVILQGQNFIKLLSNRKALTDGAIREKLDKQGSLYAQADSFRVFEFAPNAWAEFLQAALGSGAEAELRAARRRKKSQPSVEAPQLQQMQPSATLVSVKSEAVRTQPQGLIAEEKHMALEDHSHAASDASEELSPVKSEPRPNSPQHGDPEGTGGAVSKAQSRLTVAENTGIIARVMHLLRRR